MKLLKISLCAAVAIAAMAGASAASAEEMPNFTAAYNVGAATEYVFRGIDQSPTGAGTTPRCSRASSTWATGIRRPARRATTVSNTTSTAAGSRPWVR
jgi:hypothetical protein